jgi:hypothetical protein
MMNMSDEPTEIPAEELRAMESQLRSLQPAFFRLDREGAQIALSARMQETWTGDDPIRSKRSDGFRSWQWIASVAASWLGGMFFGSVLFETPHSQVGKASLPEATRNEAPEDIAIRIDRSHYDVRRSNIESTPTRDFQNPHALIRLRQIPNLLNEIRWSEIGSDQPDRRVDPAIIEPQHEQPSVLSPRSIATVLSTYN